MWGHDNLKNHFPGQRMKLTSNLLRHCYECNFPLGNRELFCPRCGARQRRERTATA
jgi:uncharacterized Zn finger protein (UPF0148 family)